MAKQNLQAGDIVKITYHSHNGIEILRREVVSVEQGGAPGAWFTHKIVGSKVAKGQPLPFEFNDDHVTLVQYGPFTLRF